MISFYFVIHSSLFKERERQDTRQSISSGVTRSFKFHFATHFHQKYKIRNPENLLFFVGPPPDRRAQIYGIFRGLNSDFYGFLGQKKSRQTE